MPLQWVTTGPTPMERVERMNAVVVRGQGQGMGAPRRNPHAMEVNRGRNCYACGRFRHMACHCRNRTKERVEQGRRVEYGEWNIEGNHGQISNLKEVENLESLN